MENYVKANTARSEPTKSATTINVKHGGRALKYAEVATKLIAKHGKITIYGQGLACNKTVSVAEILKRTLTLTSSVEISSAEETDVWNPKQGMQMDSILVTRHVPAIHITLSSSNDIPKVNL